MSVATITCKYCGAINSAGADRCQACGAPIEIPAVPPVTVTTVNNTIPTSSSSTGGDTTVEQIRDALDSAPINDQLKEGLKVVGIGAATLGVGSFFARTFSEAVAIAFSSFLIGYYSAAFSVFLLGLFGGIVIGLMVGLAVKRPWGVLLSAPLGTILGLILGRFLQSVMPALPIPVVFAIVAGGIFALIGGKSNSTNAVVKWYGRLRPLLGMMGGFLFALLGYAVGGITY